MVLAWGYFFALGFVVLLVHSGKGCLVGSEFKAVCVKLSLMLSSMSTFRCIILTIPQSSNASHALASVEERFMMCDEAAILRDIVADLSKS